MNFKLTRLSLALASAALLSLTGCGGGSSTDTPVTNNPSSSTPTTTAKTLSGTAAIGQPIVGSVVAIDVNGKMSSPATTSDTGAYVLNVDGLTAPYILTIIGTAGGKQVALNSIATAPGQTVNITPLTDLIVSTAAGQPGGSTLASLCTPVANVVAPSCLSALTTAATPAKLTAAVTAVKDMIAPLNTAGTDPLNGAFTANGEGFDGLLDKILVAPATQQGATATVTLIATNKTLGEVKLPETAGQASTPATLPLTSQDLAAATAASTVLPEVKACLASFNKLYEKTDSFTPPLQTRVEDFLDDSFLMGSGETKTAFASWLSGEGATPGFSLEAIGLSPFDMSPLTLTEAGSLSTTSVADILKARTVGSIAYATNGSPASAWVQLRPSADAGVFSMKMIKGASYNGCPGGWKIAGTQHVDMHMNPRIRRTLNGSGEVTFKREWAFHIEKDNDVTPSFDTVIVRGPGLTTYTRDSSAPASTVKTSLRLKISSDPTISWFGTRTVTGTTVSPTYYGDEDAIQSCQDLVGTDAPIGTPCIDETKVAPGMLYSWMLMKGSTNVATFPFQINAVPLSKAFATANQKDLFATVTSVTPAGISGLNSALSSFSGTVLDNFFTFNYTLSATYGSQMDNCTIGLFDGSGTAVLRAEQNAVGTKTSCTFKTAGLNSGNLAKPTGSIQGAYIGVTTIVLGNQASSSQPY